MDSFEWLNNYVQELDEKYKNESLPVIIKKIPNKIIVKNIQNSFNIGYLFLQDIYYKLKLKDICKQISDNYQYDPKRFIKATNVTDDGEVPENSIYTINQSVIDEDAKYDGLYAVCTNLDDTVEEIIEVNHRRWEIEESFRIMKSDFKSRPVYHSKDEMIKAHFITCFLSLIIYRYLEKKLDE